MDKRSVLGVADFKAIWDRQTMRENVEVVAMSVQGGSPPRVMLKLKGFVNYVDLTPAMARALADDLRAAADQLDPKP